MHARLNGILTQCKVVTNDVSYGAVQSTKKKDGDRERRKKSAKWDEIYVRYRS